MQHTAGFLRLVDEARPRIREISVDEARAWMSHDPPAILIDVREDHEWAAGHAAGAVHLGKGILERDLERMFPDPNAELILYCGGGYRSALSCNAARTMGYTRVASLIGGFRAIAASGWNIVP